MNEQATQRVRSFAETKEDWRKYCEHWKSYPDHFLDFIKSADCPIDLYFYQRIMLRILFRYKKVYYTFTRGTAKSYTQILALYLKCVMNPRSKLFLCAPGKEQAANITKANVEAIWTHFPILQNEIDIKKCRFEKDMVVLYFRNDSKLEVIPVSQSARGGRNTGGAIEEIVDEKMKKEEINEVIIPRMANDRLSMYRDPDTGSTTDPYENHKSLQIVTTAGTRQSYAYEKLMEVLWEMAEGKSAFFLGAGFELATMHGQLSHDFIMDIKEAPTTNPLGFAREYESVWTGSSENSLVALDDLQKCRVLSKIEDRHCGDKDVEYVLAYDVARAENSQAASCALAVIKITPRGDGTYVKHMVNMFSFQGTHFRDQAIFLKRKVEEFKARILVVDANGVGKGLVDELVLEIDENVPYSVVNDDDGTWNRYKQENSRPMIFAMSTQKKEMKASDVHNVFIQAITHQKIKLPYSESQARSNADKKLKNADSEKIARELMGFTMTDLLCDEIMNLEYRQAGGNQTKVEQISKSINKDKFSALEYGLWYIYTLERDNVKRKKESGNAWQFMAVRKGKSMFQR